MDFRSARLAPALQTLLLCVLALLALPAAAQQFLPPDQAYRYTTEVSGEQLLIKWQVQPDYYLYKAKMAVASAQEGVTLGEVNWPAGQSHTDEYFGTQDIYRGNFTVAVPFTVAGARPDAIDLELKLQGCADAGLCYPPLTWKTQVTLPAAAASGAAPRGNPLSAFFKSRSNDDEFLPPDEAFQFTVQANDAGS